MTLSEGEAELALMALRHTRWVAEHQTTETASVSYARDAAWFCARHCITEMSALIARIEKEKADG